MEARALRRKATTSTKLTNAVQTKALVSNNITAVNKRKKGASQSEQPSKRSALGDLTNRKAESSTSEKVSKAVQKKTTKSTSQTDSDFSSSQELISSLKHESSQEIKSGKALIESSKPEAAKAEEQKHVPSSHSHIQFNIPPPPCADFSHLNFYDIDKENPSDVFSHPEYAQDIFNYMKNKECECMVDDYMPRQPEITPSMRSVLVDWLVEVQENFELNHETLYLAVKLVDHYLMRRVVNKETLQLVGAAAVFIGCKFDERIPPMVDDFLYICDDAYNRVEFVRMEKEILKTVDFNLSMPLSYSFLRRFAKAGRKSMQLLTLARYINETVLMSYKIIKYKESLVAAGCLRLAMKMCEPDAIWDDTLVYYTGYRDEDLKDVVKQMNHILHHKNPSLQTIENKYSHQVFFEVAKKSLVPQSELYPESSSSTTSAVYV